MKQPVSHACERGRTTSARPISAYSSASTGASSARPSSRRSSTCDDVLREVGEGVVGAGRERRRKRDQQGDRGGRQREHQQPLRARDEVAGAAEPAADGEGVGGRVRHGGRV